MSLLKIKINIISDVNNEGDAIPEHSEETLVGYMKYSETDGVEHISYKTERDGQKTETKIELRGNLVCLVRKGAIESTMLFERGKNHSSLYKIPPFSFDMTLFTKCAEYSLSPLGGEITLEYKMTVGGAEKDCFMRIKVTPV